jgi:predicted dehydrogenase
MNIAIIGCGLIGRKRAASLRRDDRLIGVTDRIRGCAERLASEHEGCVVVETPDDLLGRSDVDLVVVATTNDALAGIALAAIEHGKHVIVEKPAARRAAEVIPLVTAARARGVVVKVGFNHRFHPAVLKARELWDGGACGPLMYIRGRYGHGGRLGMDKEWRGDPSISGGGEMLDQGVHLIDLSRWFAGEFVEVRGRVERYFWGWAVEDNGFAHLRTAGGQVAWLHASCTEWKNLFSFEVFGRDAKLQIDGLGGSYGVERLTYYRMRPEMGPPETTIWEYPGADSSWQAEIAHVVECIQTGRPVVGGLDDAKMALDIVEELYARSGPDDPVLHQAVP